MVKKILFSILFVLILFSTVEAHDHWISKYRNEFGTSCCGEGDCFKVEADRVTRGVCGYMVDGVCIPPSHIKPSEDKNYWHCPNYRCFFVPGGLT